VIGKTLDLLFKYRLVNFYSYKKSKLIHEIKRDSFDKSFVLKRLYRYLIVPFEVIIIEKF